MGLLGRLRSSNPFLSFKVVERGAASQAAAWGGPCACMIGRPIQHELLGLARQLVAHKLAEVSEGNVHFIFWQRGADHSVPGRLSGAPGSQHLGRLHCLRGLL